MKKILSIGLATFLMISCFIFFFVYLLIYPFIVPSTESLNCNQNYICSLDKKYFLRRTTKKIKLDRSASRIHFKTIEHKSLQHRYSHSNWSYGSNLILTDAYYNDLKPFGNRFLFYEEMSDLTISSQEENVKSSIRNFIKTSNQNLENEFNDYLKNPKQNFKISKKNDTTMIYRYVVIPIIILILMIKLFFILTKNNTQQQDKNDIESTVSENNVTFQILKSKKRKKRKKRKQW